MENRIKWCMVHPDEIVIAHATWVEKGKDKSRYLCICCGNEWWRDIQSKKLERNVSCIRQLNSSDFIR